MNRPSTRKRFTNLKVWIVAALAISTLVAACSGGSGGRYATPASAPATTTPAAAAALPVIIGSVTGPARERAATLAAGTARTTVAVTLADDSLTADKTTVTAGVTRFIATNVSGAEIHELAILKINADGSFDDVGAASAIGPQQGGAITLDLAPGAYRLACLIGAGTSVDHYRRGEHTDFKVE